MLLDRHIGPVVPRRDTYLARQLVDAIDSTTLVAASDNQLVADSLNDIFLGLAFQIAQLSLLHPLVNLFVHTNSSNDNRSER